MLGWNHRTTALTSAALRAALAALFVLSSVAACSAIVGFDQLQKSRAASGGDDGDGDDDGDDPRPRSDASTSSKIDAGREETSTPSGPRCDPQKPFGTPAVVTAFGTTDVSSAVLTPDELEAFFFSYADGKLRHARRENRDAPWSVVTENLTPSTGFPVSISSDGLKLYLSSTGADYKFFVATRNALGEAFTTTQSLTIPPSTFASPTLFVVNAGDKVYLSRRAGTDGSRLAFAGLQGTTIASTTTDLANTHATGALDDAPVLNSSETVMYFASTRAGGNVWVTRRPSKDADFSPPKAVAELTGPILVTWASDDDCVIYLDGDLIISEARRPL